MIEALLSRFPALKRVPPPAYVVGGAIRDLLLGREPFDVDVVCASAADCASRLSNRTIRLGGRHGGERFAAYRVVIEQKVYDFSDLTGGKVEVDLLRRDFTINAIAIELPGGPMFDPLAGCADIDRRLVRMVGRENFADDPLRTLKAVRLAVVLELVIEQETLDAVRDHAPLLATVAAERVSHELSLIFSTGRFRTALALLRETALDRSLFGAPLGGERFHDDAVTMAGAFALLVPDPRSFAKRWRWSEALLRDVLTLQSLLRVHADRRAALFDAGERVSAQLPPVLRAIDQPEDAAAVERLLTEELFATRPLLTGDEIARAAGIAPGPEVGRRKRALLEAQLRGEVRTREEALQFVLRA